MATPATGMPPGTVLLVDQLTPGASSLLFEAPRRLIVAYDAEEARRGLAALEAARAEGLWAAGYCAYELGYLFEEKLLHLLPARPERPLLWFGLYDRPQRLDGAGAAAKVADWAGGRIGRATGLAAQSDFAGYRPAFDAVKTWIADGDCYQVNLTFKARFDLKGDPAGLYRDLMARQHTAYGALIAAGDHWVLSSSPELFVRRTGDRLACRPMKGTAGRGATPDEDARAAAALRADEKNRAENLMIVDLLRNDMSRIAEIGSVAVTDLFSVETYPSLHTLTSGITARLTPGLTPGDVLQNLFPCGSITGAPKIRAMEIISELETGPRGAYCGAIGWIAPEGDFCFNVAIRTAVIAADGRGEIGIGGGIVADSEARSEYDEALLKLRFFAETAAPLGLIETLLWEKGAGYTLLGRHLDRLARSAAAFGIALPEGAAAAALDRAAGGFSEPRMRVRLLLEETGALSVTATPLPVPDTPPLWRFAVAPERQHSTDPYLGHKTTRRQTLDPPRQRAAAALGVDEVVFRNERGELTEGSMTNLFVERGGVLLTPPLSSGLLPGTLRAELLATGWAREALLYPEDLATAEAVYFGNSVRGLVRAVRYDAPRD